MTSFRSALSTTSILLAISCLAVSLLGSSVAQATPNTPHGVWHGRYDCGNGPQQLELVVSVAPRIGAEPAHPVRAVVTIDFTERKGGPVKRATAEFRGAYGPNMKRLELLEVDRVLVKPEGLGNLFLYVGEYDPAARSLNLSFRGAPGACKLQITERTDQPRLFAGAWQHLGLGAGGASAEVRNAGSVPPTPHGVWSTTYTCNGRTLPLELTINVDPLDPNQRNHPVTAAVAFDFAAEQSNTIKRGAVVLKGAYGPNMKAVHIKSTERFIIRPPELRNPATYEGFYEPASGLLRLTFSSGDCKMGPMKRIDRPTLLPTAWRHVADPAKVAEAPGDFGIAVPPPVAMITCGAAHDCHQLVGSWAGRASCGDTGYLYRFDLPPADNSLGTTSETVRLGHHSGGAALRAQIQVVDLNSGAVGLFSMVGEGGGRGMDLKQPTWVKELPAFTLSNFSAHIDAPKGADGLRGHFDTKQCSGWIDLTRVTRAPSDVVNENKLLAQRDAVSGDWTGIIDCESDTFPTQAEVAHAKRSGSVSFAFAGRSMRLQILPPQIPVSKVQAETGSLFKAETADKQATLTVERARTLPGNGSYVGGRLEVPAGHTALPSCRAKTPAVHLARLAPSPLASGPYATARTFNERCAILRRWVEPAEGELKAIADLLREPSIRLGTVHSTQGALITILGADHFEKVFGVPLEKATQQQVEDLFEHTRYCAMVASWNDGAGIAAGTTTAIDRGVRIGRAMSASDPAPWLPVDGLGKVDAWAAKYNATREDEALEAIRRAIESQFTSPQNTFRNLQEFFAERGRLASEVRPSRLKAILPEIQSRLPGYLVISARRAEEERVARAAAAEAEEKRRAAAAAAEEKRKLEACIAQGPIGSRPPTDAELGQALSNYFLSTCSTPQLAWKIFQNPGQAANSAQWLAMLALARAERDGNACRISAMMFQGRFGISSASVRSCQPTGGGQFQCNAMIQMSCSAGAVQGYNGPPVTMQANIMCAAIAADPSTTTVNVRQLNDCSWVAAPTP
jgi:hypothetical protein